MPDAAAPLGVSTRVAPAGVGARDVAGGRNRDPAPDWKEDWNSGGANPREDGGMSAGPRAKCAAAAAAAFPAPAGSEFAGSCGK